MADRFRGSRRGLPAPKRQIANDGVADTVTTATLTFGANAAATAAGTFGIIVNIAAATLVRTRGSLIFRVRASGGANNLISLVYGMYVSTDVAFAFGITALITPMSEVENDWFVWEPVSLVASAAGTQGINAISANHQRQFDSRGMRKLKSGDVLAVVVEGVQSDATTGTIVDIGYTFRNQFKL